MSSFSRGDYVQPQLSVRGYNLTAAICYEIVLGQQVRDNFRPRHQPAADHLQRCGSATPSARGSTSRWQWQHAEPGARLALRHQRRYRRGGCERRGDRRDPQFTRQVLEVKVTPATGVTPYARFGATPLWVITLLLGGWALMLACAANSFRRGARRAAFCSTSPSRSENAVKSTRLAHSLL